MEFEETTLTLADERELATAIEAGLAAAAVLRDDHRAPRVRADREELAALVRAGEEARRRFLLANCRLVMTIASQAARRYGLSIDELFQEGFLGLVAALERFDHARGVPFCSVAAPWVRSRVSEQVATRAGTLHVPGRVARRKGGFRAVPLEAAGDVGILDEEPHEVGLGRALAGLGEVERELLLAHVVDGLTLKDAALRASVPTSTARRMLDRTLARLREDPRLAVAA